jgi:diguanylate cyclase (GGDEF)-like protein
LGSVTLGDCCPLPEALPAAGAWIALPLITRGERVGLLLASSPLTDVYTDAHVQIAAALAGQGMTAYENARLFDRVHELATVDELTGVANRRHFFERASAAFAAAGDQPLAAIMIDVDHFKRVNDSFGHLVGDDVLREVARRLALTVREVDLLGRFGGEEFALLVTADRADSSQLAERLRAAVAGEPVATAVGPLPVTVSVGLASLRPYDNDLGSLLGRADRALYDAKALGRDRVVVA